MSVIHPSPSRISALCRRWEGQASRLQAIAASMLAGTDWTVHLEGLPMIEEVPPVPGEAYGRDLRGADLRSHLSPPIRVATAPEQAAAVVANITLDAVRNNTPLPGISPFTAELESAEQTAVAMRRGDTFLMARSGEMPVGVVRLARRREFCEYTAHRAYVEISGLAVMPAHRRQGVACALLEAAEEHARRDGYDYALLRTTMEMGLVPYYERRGYAVRLTRQMTFAGAPACLDAVMVKCLDAHKRTSTTGRLRGLVRRTLA